MSEQLYAGFAKDKITPPLGMNIPGYFSKRLATGVITDLYVQATALQCGDTKAVIFTVDSLGMYISGYRAIRSLVSERLGLDEKAIYICCSHTHTGTRIVAPKKENLDIEDIFWGRVFQQFVDTAQYAFEDLKPVSSVKIARGEAKDIAFIRRYRMKDGTCKTNPATGDPNIDSFDGVQDESVQLVRMIREEGKEILFVNFGTHPDVIGGTKYCADWPGYTRDILRGAMDDSVEVMMLIGCQGDSNHVNRFLPKGTVTKGVPYAQRMARVISGEVLKIYDSAKDVPHTKITFDNRVLDIAPNPYDPADVPEALEIKAIYDKLQTSYDPIYKQFKLNVPEALRIARHHNGGPKSYPVQVSALQLGNIAFVGFAGEPFVEIGLKVKEASKMTMTVCTCVTNSGQGYFPTASAFAEAGYERSASPFEHTIAQKLIDAAMEMISEMEMITEE